MSALTILVGGGMGEGEEESDAGMGDAALQDKLAEEIGKAFAAKDWTAAAKALGRFVAVCDPDAYDEEEMTN